MSEERETNDPPEFTNWKDAWEWHAAQVFRDLVQQPEESLLSQVAAGRYDLFYSVWFALREVGTLAKCAPVLLDVLRRETGKEMDLVRYHCAGTLFHLLGYPDHPLSELRERVQWDHAGETARQAAIEELEALIASSTG